MRLGVRGGIERDQTVFANVELGRGQASEACKSLASQSSQRQKLEAARPHAVIIDVLERRICVDRHALAGGRQKGCNTVLVVRIPSGRMTDEQRTIAPANEIFDADGAVQTSREKRHAIDLRQIDDVNPPPDGLHRRRPNAIGLETEAPRIAAQEHECGFEFSLYRLPARRVGQRQHDFELSVPTVEGRITQYECVCGGHGYGD